MTTETQQGQQIDAAEVWRSQLGGWKDGWTALKMRSSLADRCQSALTACST